MGTASTGLTLPPGPRALSGPLPGFAGRGGGPRQWEGAPVLIREPASGGDVASFVVTRVLVPGRGLR